MKATLAVATTLMLTDVKPGQLFTVAERKDGPQAICALQSSNDAGCDRPLWSVHKADHLCVVVIASLQTPDEIGYRPTGSVVHMASHIRVMPIEQVEACSFRTKPAAIEI